MKINQRYKEQDNRQKIVKSKVYQNYINHIEELINDTQLSFNSLQTPGWTSLVNTQQNKNIHINTKYKHQNNQDTHIQILNRLNSLPKLKTNQQNYSNIRLNPSLTKNKNIFIYGSLKMQDKKKNQTPKSKQYRISPKNSNKNFNQSKKITNSQIKFKNSSSNKFLNRFSSNKPAIFFSVQKNSQNNVNNDTSRKRTGSVRSQPHTNLKDRIKQRLSTGNYKPKNITSDFQSNIKTQPNQNMNNQSKLTSPDKFYSKIHAIPPIKEQKNQYLNRYLNKLNQRTKSNLTVKIFKKPNQNQIKSKIDPIIIKQTSQTSKQNILPLTHRRFNSITIHDHLYQNSIKLQSKKNMQRLIDDSYQKATTLTFTPAISEKSNFLAQSKFSKQSNTEYINQKNCLDSCFRKNNSKQLQNKQLKGSMFTVQQKVAMKQKQKMAQKLQARTLNKLFSILSNNTSQINDKNLQINIQKLPLSLIQLLEPLLTDIYKKSVFNENRFIQIFEQSSQKSIKQMVLKKQMIMSQTQRYLRVMLKNEIRQKQNNKGNVNIQQTIISKLK